MEDRLGPHSHFRQPPPAGVAGAGCAIAATTVPNEIDVNVLVSRPMTLEVVKEERPVERQTVLLEISQGK